MKPPIDQIDDFHYLSLGGLFSQADCFLVESNCYRSAINRILESDLFISHVERDSIKEGCGGIYFYSVLVGDV